MKDVHTLLEIGAAIEKKGRELKEVKSRLAVFERFVGSLVLDDSLLNYLEDYEDKSDEQVRKLILELKYDVEHD